MGGSGITVVPYRVNHDLYHPAGDPEESGHTFTWQGSVEEIVRLSRLILRRA